MTGLLAAVLAAGACASSLQAQTSASSALADGESVLSLDQAIAAAGSTVPTAEAAAAGVLQQLQVPIASGGFVPLSSVAAIKIVDGPNQISRENGKRQVVVQANVRGRGVVAEAQGAVARRVRLPAGTYLEWGGQFANLRSASARLQLVIPGCFLLILLLLYGALGSVRDAAIVFTGVPFALVGGVLLLFVRGMDFSISAAVGFIALSGIAVLNGLVMVSAVQDLIRAGMARAEAAKLGAMQRLRPVAMTALVASLGFVPMALGHGAGAEVQKPLATVVIGIPSRRRALRACEHRKIQTETTIRRAVPKMVECERERSSFPGICGG